MYMMLCSHVVQRLQLGAWQVAPAHMWVGVSALVLGLQAGYHAPRRVICMLCPLSCSGQLHRAAAAIL
jgi:hypothetical protein